MSDVHPLVYVGFIAFVLAMLVIDLKFFHAESHEPTPRESGAWVAVWVTLAIVFGIGVWIFSGGELAAEYFTGYLIEYSLSVDNMFVFVLIFSYFKVPFRYQHNVLFYGILGALVFRGIFIALGVALINNFEWIIYVFGAFLIFTAIRLAMGTEEVHPEDNPILKFLQKRLRTTPRYDGQKFFTIENGKKVATPLVIVLAFIEMTDIVFAVDSIPAIFGITRDPFIVLTSNVFAILGLRALYFLLADVMDRFHLLKYGLAIILGFVGVKMLLEMGVPDVDAFGAAAGFHYGVPIWASLGVIVSVLAISAYLSLKIPPKHPHRVPRPPHEGEVTGEAPIRDDTRDGEPRND
ncbi:MAG: TerC family protein [Actinobacteria bacterium]|nr:TerC family protein [Actinomycetota bacterium]